MSYPFCLVFNFDVDNIMLCSSTHSEHSRFFKYNLQFLVVVVVFQLKWQQVQQITWKSHFERWKKNFFSEINFTQARLLFNSVRCSINRMKNNRESLNSERHKADTTHEHHNLTIAVSLPFQSWCYQCINYKKTWW